MFQGNWPCSKCGGSITELPFQPRSEKGLTCRACFAQQRSGSNSTAGEVDTETAPEYMMADGGDDRQDVPPFDPEAPAGEPAPAPEGSELGTPVDATERRAFAGDWQCSLCGGAITSLPFEPRSTANLKCIDCFKQGKS